MGLLIVVEARSCAVRIRCAAVLQALPAASQPMIQHHHGAHQRGEWLARTLARDVERRACAASKTVFVSDIGAGRGAHPRGRRTDPTRCRHTGSRTEGCRTASGLHEAHGPSTCDLVARRCSGSRAHGSCAPLRATCRQHLHDIGLRRLRDFLAFLVGSVAEGPVRIRLQAVRVATFMLTTTPSIRFSMPL